MTDRRITSTLGLLALAVCFRSGSGLSEAHLTQRSILPYPRGLTGGNYMHSYYLPPPGGGGPSWPSWSPDGQSLAFAMQGSIWRMRLGESVAHELVHAREYLSSPEWSPDGRYVAFTAEDDGTSINLRLLDLRSGGVTNITEGDDLNLDPAWSRDASRLAYVSTSPNGYFNIFVVTIADGKPTARIQLSRDRHHSRARSYLGANFGTADLHIQTTRPMSIIGVTGGKFAAVGRYTVESFPPLQ